MALEGGEGGGGSNGGQGGKSFGKGGREGGREGKRGQEDAPTPSKVFFPSLPHSIDPFLPPSLPPWTCPTYDEPGPKKHGTSTLIISLYPILATPPLPGLLRRLFRGT
jgi:hypothetical protein